MTALRQVSAQEAPSFNAETWAQIMAEAHADFENELLAFRRNGGGNREKQMEALAAREWAERRLAELVGPVKARKMFNTALEEL